MKIRDRRKEITIYIKNDEIVDGKLFHKTLLDKLVELHVTGCTIVKSNAGFGMDMKLKYTDSYFTEFWSRESTVIITVIETESKTEEIIALLDSCMPQGIVSIKDVEVIRYTKTVVPASSVSPGRIRPSTP